MPLVLVVDGAEQVIPEGQNVQVLRSNLLQNVIRKTMDKFLANRLNLCIFASTNE